MSDEHSGYIFNVTKPKKKNQGFVARLAVTPKKKDSSADLNAKIERDLGHEKAVEIAVDLLKLCGAPTDLLERVEALQPSAIEG